VADSKVAVAPFPELCLPSHPRKDINRWTPSLQPTTGKVKMPVSGYEDPSTLSSVHNGLVYTLRSNDQDKPIRIGL
jgi:hypothetical protein